MDLIAETAKDFDPDNILAEWDLIALVRTTVRMVHDYFGNLDTTELIFVFQIWASSLWCHSFAELQAMIYKQEYQLLWDVDIRWSSTLLMIDQFLYSEM